VGISINRTLYVMHSPVATYLKEQDGSKVYFVFLLEQDESEKQWTKVHWDQRLSFKMVFVNIILFGLFK